MTEDKIMAGGNLDNILRRMVCCCAVLDVIAEAASDKPLADAIAGANALLQSIYQDFDADISSAEEYHGEEAQG